MNVIILAAGLGKRMKSRLPKVLHPILGKPLIRYVADLAYSLSPQQVIVVVSRQHAAVKHAVPQSRTVYVVQAVPRGTGDAAIKGLARVRRGLVLILSGDAPYLKRSSVEQMIQLHRRHRSDLTVICAELADPGVYGRVIVGPNGQIRRIVEQTDASPAEKRVKLINGGMYLADADLLKKALTMLRPNNRQREYYLTDAVKIIIGQRGRVFPFVLKDANEVLGVNSQEELAEMRRLIKDDFYRELMRAGVLIEDPASTTIDRSVIFGREVVIKPNTVIEGVTRIGDSCVIGPHAWIRNRSVKRHTRLAFRKLVREA